MMQKPQTRIAALKPAIIEHVDRVTAPMARHRCGVFSELCGSGAKLCGSVLGG